MRKFLIMIALLMGVVCVKAQIATENSNVFDNVGLSITAGVSTPLDFNSVFPLNTNVGLKITKDFTPYFGLQAEGLAFLNDNHFSSIKTAVKATNVGLNSAFNLSNMFWGYKGTPRVFEISAVAGLGWLHVWDTSVNSLTSKTGLDLAFNLGKKKAHSLVLTPAVYWNLNKLSDLQFNKKNAQLALNLSYIYHFKTSNGTHHFKTYDVGAMTDEINYLRGRLDERESKPVPTAAAVVKVPVEKIVETILNGQWFVEFAQGDATLDNAQKEKLNAIPDNLVVDITGFASPEGSDEINKKLSEDRAKAVADYLTNRGVKVGKVEGVGVGHGDNTNRLVVITLAK